MFASLAPTACVLGVPIKSKKSKEWKKVDNLIKGLSNKILLGNVYAERYLHPTGWRSSYTDLKKWLDKYNDHPDATRITRIALKRKPKNLKSPKKPTPGFLNGYGTYKSNVLKPRFPIDNYKHKTFSYSTSFSLLLPCQLCHLDPLLLLRVLEEQHLYLIRVLVYSQYPNQYQCLLKI